MAELELLDHPTTALRLLLDRTNTVGRGAMHVAGNDMPEEDRSQTYQWENAAQLHWKVCGTCTHWKRFSEVPPGQPYTPRYEERSARQGHRLCLLSGFGGDDPDAIGSTWFAHLWTPSDFGCACWEDERVR